MVSIHWCGDVSDDELNVLHADAFEHALLDDAWNAQLQRWSLGWVTARSAGELVGFLNVLTDGGVHAWVQDVIVAGSARRLGIGVQMMALVTQQVTDAGCEWLHVDFDEQHRAFYIDACGFSPASAGLIAL